MSDSSEQILQKVQCWRKNALIPDQSTYDEACLQK